MRNRRYLMMTAIPTDQNETGIEIQFIVADTLSVRDLTLTRDGERIIIDMDNLLVRTKEFENWQTVPDRESYI